MAGGVHKLVRVVGHYKAAELVLTGRDIPAAEALELKLVNFVVPDDEVESRALKLAVEIAGNSPDSIQCGLYGECVVGQRMGRMAKKGGSADRRD